MSLAYGQSLHDDLRNDKSIQNALNVAFDKIGFSENFIQNRKIELKSRRNKKTTLIKDVVWGMMEFEPADVELIDTPIMQRLRDIKQLGLTYQVYPSAEHTRFAHSLGVAHASRSYLDEIASKKTKKRISTSSRLDHSGGQLEAYNFEDDSESQELGRLLVHAALLHDVGHLPFSHASEAAIHDDLTHYKIGKNDIQDIFNVFAENIPNLSDPKIAEFMSVIVILSDRFSRFYQDIILKSNDTEATRTCLSTMALLILGRSPRADFPGIGQIISSHNVDADKVDYVQRDSILCNIPVGVDVARLFHRSCFLKISGGQLRNLGQPEDKPQIHFVLNAAGVDSAEEMVHSRAILFHRVYRHKTTRLLERIWCKALREITEKQDLTKVTEDITTIWSENDNSILALTAQQKENSFYKAIGLRRIPRRVMMLNSDVIDFPRNTLDFLPSEIEGVVLSCEKQIVGNYLKQLEFSTDRLHGQAIDDLEADIVAFSRQISTSIGQAHWSELKVFFVPLDERQNSGIRSQITLEKSFVQPRKSGNREAQQAAARGANKNAGYIFAEYDAGRESADEIILLASCIALSEWSLKNEFAPPEMPLGEKKANGSFANRVSGSDTDFSSMPTLVPELSFNSKAICTRIGMNTEEFFNVSKKALCLPSLSRYSFLLRHDLENKSLAEKFSEYRGVGDWTITTAHLQNFLSQFPVKLRADAENLVSEVMVIGRADARNGLMSFLKEIDSDTSIVPFTRTSGTTYTELAKAECVPLLRESGHVFSSTIGGVEDGKQVLFFDDNISTGFQAKAVLHKLAGVKMTDWPTELVQEFDKVSDIDSVPEKLRQNLNYGFLVGYQEGVDELVSCAQSLNLADSVLIHRAPQPDNFQQLMTDELKSFLTEVGTELIVNSQDISSLVAEQDAMGSCGLSGLFTSKDSAPASLITCFWHPGLFQKRPWIPLFIRRGYQDRVYV